jgi:hypothetical protein
MEIEKPRQLEYTPDFKELIAQNPGVLKSFLKLEKEIAEATDEDIQSEKSFSEGEVKITPLYDFYHHNKYLKQNNLKLNSYLKVEVAGEEFFVKTISGFIGESSGIEELQSLKKQRSF